MGLQMGAELPKEMEAAWGLEDLEHRMEKLLVPGEVTGQGFESSEEESGGRGGSGSSPESNGGGAGEAVERVDQFLRDALANPRERLTILRMEQQVEKFMQNANEQQLVFEHLPTSYLRLVAHRVAQHYGLQSMVAAEANSADGSNSRIIARKTSKSGSQVIRLADIPANLPQDEKTNAVKFEIKQRMPKGSYRDGANVNSSKFSFAKSVEERKEEYIKARARIFNDSSSGELGTSDDDEFGSTDYEQCFSLRVSSPEGKHSKDQLQNNHAKTLTDCSAGNGGTNNSRGEREPAGRGKPNNNRVAIFRDREKDKKDPDYDRSYDRYNQRIDPGFGLNSGSFNMQALYPPVNCNSDFPYIGAAHRAQIHMEPPPPVPPHTLGPWVTPPNMMGYVPSDFMMRPFNHGHLGTHSASAMYLQSSQYACPSPAMPYMHHHEWIQHPLARPHLQQQPAASFGQARRR
uniref:TSA: Wollemia nobilis Ref_Wollemi_Transcript_3736_2087 transcribed RNA sequence n=1 Tax=Wollemia nobilis TaxID=56998 RepID=A0A0C9QWM8_9CONI